MEKIISPSVKSITAKLYLTLTIVVVLFLGISRFHELKNAIEQQIIFNRAHTNMEAHLKIEPLIIKGMSLKESREYRSVLSQMRV
jgi:hypothetical protein